MNDPRQEHDSELGEEIRSALLYDAPREEERAAMARAALERAEQPEPRRRLVRLAPWLSAAAAAAVVFGFVLPGTDHDGAIVSRDPDRKHAAGTVEEERKANLEFLRSEKVQRHLRENPGLWAAIAGGDSLVVTAPLEKVLAGIERAEPKAKHRFVWRIGEEGDVAYNLTFGDQPWAGMKFLTETRLTLGRGKKPGWTFYTEQDPKKQAQFVGKDKRPWLPIVVGVPGRDEGTKITFVVSTGSNCPLLLPEGHRFPLSEIPGTAVVDSGLNRAQWQLRRYLVRARIPELGFDMDVEALELAKPVKRGAERLVLGGLPWLAYEDGVLEKAGREGKPVLLLFGSEVTPKLEAVFQKAGDLKPLLRRFVLVHPGDSVEVKAVRFRVKGAYKMGSGPSLVVLHRDPKDTVTVGPNLSFSDGAGPVKLRYFLEQALMGK